MRRVWATKIGWDDSVPKAIQTDWNNLMKELKQTTKLIFSRAVTPPNPIDKPVLVVFSDGSETAFGAVAYSRWKTSKGYDSFLFATKSRLAPLKKINTV